MLTEGEHFYLVRALVVLGTDGNWMVVSEWRDIRVAADSVDHAIEQAREIPCVMQTSSYTRKILDVA